MHHAFRTVTFQGFALVAAGFALTVVAQEAKAGPPPATAVVRIANFTFNQAQIAVRPGATVTWINDDDIPHTVTSTTQAFKSKVLDTGDRFSFTFAKTGQFAYFCSLHPHMTGKVVVKA
jgi:plastocyanin